MDFHYANMWEAISDAIPDRTLTIHGTSKRTWAEVDDRAARVCSALMDAGLEPGSKVGLYLTNCSEYIEAHHGAFKGRFIPINVNYRYLEDELVYLLDNSDCEALFFHRQYADRVAAIKDRLPNIKLFVQVSDGSDGNLEGAADFEDLIRSFDPAPRISRPGTDIYMLYTGGTTGMPKGVMYEHQAHSSALLLGYGVRGIDPPTTVEATAEAVKKMVAANAAPTSLVCCPLMHGTGMWVGTLAPSFLGGTVVTNPNTHFDPHEVWQLAEREKVTEMTIVGDAFARPLLRALESATAEGKPYDISSVQMMVSSGVMWTKEVKEGLLEYGNMMLLDAFGSTEGSMGMSVTSREMKPDTAKFELGENVKVITDDGRFVEPGSEDIGKVATTGNIPIGYYKDEKKTAETFREVEGVRYSFPGDYAKIEADGTIVLLGRGSVCINTGGEKVFPEEVEEALKRHDAVDDCLVVGVPDERFGERVVAVACHRKGMSVGEEDLIEFSKSHLSGYKLPRTVLFVDQVKRAPNGKADYKWAKATATDLAG